MVRNRAASASSSKSGEPPVQVGTRIAEVARRLSDLWQELGSMYDYLAKIVLLGPSGAGK
jgi:hypothetical protein